MADVTVSSRFADDGRGQLFLVTALAIAVLLVSLALVLNTAIYTENIATRTTDTQLDEATSGQRAAVDASGAILDAENRAGGTRPEIESRFESSVGNWSETSATLVAANGFTVNVSYADSYTDGVRIHQDDASRNFTDNSSNRANWTVVSDGHVRGIRLNVSRTSLDTSYSDAFRLVVDDSGPPVTVSMHNDGTNVVVTVENDTGVVGSCNVEPLQGDSLVVDVGAKTVGNRYCSPLETVHEETSGDVDVEFVNADEVTGTYELFATSSDFDVLLDDSAFALLGSGWPVEDDAIYDANVTFVFQSSGTTMKKEIRIAPGELE